MTAGLAGVVGCEPHTGESETEKMRRREILGGIPVRKFMGYGDSTNIAIGDMDGDGKNDIVACTYIDGSHTIYVFLNKGDGIYIPQVPKHQVEAESNKDIQEK